MSNETSSLGPEEDLTYAQQLKRKRDEHMAQYLSSQQQKKTAISEGPPRQQRRSGGENAQHNSGRAPGEMTYVEMVRQRRDEHLKAFSQQEHQKRLSEKQKADRMQELKESLARKEQEARQEREKLKIIAITNLREIVTGKKRQTDNSDVSVVLRNLNLTNFQEYHLPVLKRHLPDLLHWMDANQNHDAAQFVQQVEKNDSDAQLKQAIDAFENRLLASVRMHSGTLHKKRRQLLWTNDYGVVKGMDKWIREIQEFINDVVHMPTHVQPDYEYYEPPRESWRPVGLSQAGAVT